MSPVYAVGQVEGDPLEVSRAEEGEGSGEIGPNASEAGDPGPSVRPAARAQLLVARAVGLRSNTPEVKEETPRGTKVVLLNPEFVVFVPCATLVD